MSKKLLIPLILLLVFLVLITGAAYFSQTNTFKKWLGVQVTDALTNTINGQVVIGKIDGNLVTNLHITGLQVITPADTILGISELTIKFKPLDLLHKKVTFHIISIDSPVIKLARYPDNTWNLATLLKKDKDENPQQKTESNPGFSLNISCDKILIGDGFLQVITGVDSLDIYQVRNINVIAGFSLKDGQLSARLEKLQLQNLNPPINIQEMQFSLKLDSLLSVQNLLLHTDSSQITGGGKWNLTNNQIEQLELKTESLNLAKVKQLIPSLPMSGNARLAIRAHSYNDTLQYQLAVKKESGDIALQGFVTTLKEQPSFDIHISAVNIDLYEWIDNLPFPIHLSGACQIQGTGKDLEHLKTRVAVQLPRGIVNNISFKDLDLKAVLENKNIKADLQVQHGPGKITAGGTLGLENNMPFSLAANIQKLNLVKLNPSLSSDINGIVQAKGTVNNNQEIYVSGNFAPSTIADFLLDTLFTRFSYQNEHFILDTLYLHSMPGELCLNGAGKIDSLTNINFLFKPDQYSTLLPGHDLKAGGAIAGVIAGSIDSFHVKTQIDLVNLTLDSHSVKNLKGMASVYYAKEKINGSSSLSLYDNVLAGFKADSLYIKADLINNELTSATSIAVNDTISGYINSSLHFNDFQTVSINSLDLNLGEMNWHGENLPATLIIKKNEYSIYNFNIRSATQSIAIFGKAGYQGDEKLSVIVQNLDLRKISNLVQPGLPVLGIIDMQTQITGSLNEPLITSDIQCTDLQYQTINITNADAKMLVNNNTLQLNARVNRNAAEELTVTGTIPVNIKAKQDEQIIPQDKPIYLAINSQSIDISFLDLFMNNTTRTSGKTSFDLQVTETLARPDINGIFSIQNGSFAVPKYGSNFDNIQLQVELNNNKITLNKFTAKNDRGQLQVNGYIGLSNKFDKWEESNIVIKANNYPLAKSQNLELTINSNILLKGDFDNLVFDGTIDISRAKIYIPAFLTSGKSNGDQSASALEQMTNDRVKKTAASVTALDKARGKIKINMPRNVWLRNDEMNVELGGSMDVLKESPEINLFGDIQTIRGTMDLYGKQFKIKEGQFTFTGSKDLTPDINITALYEFRDVYNEKKTLTLNITGKIKQPTISFLLGETQIEEKDAISYLLFGRSSDELSFGEKSQLAQNQSMVSSSGVEQMFTLRLSGEITQELQKRLNLDMIKVKGKGSRGNASLILGKYITNDLFLSYQKDFNLGGSHEMATDEIALEYEINRFLFLQATKGDDKTTGFDLFWKYEK